jgi:hypothetical protein
VYIMSKKADLTFLSKMSRVYETLRSFVWFTPKVAKSPLNLQSHTLKHHERLLRGSLEAICVGASWRCSGTIPKASRPPRCGRCSVWIRAWLTRVSGCCAMGWCSVWDGGDMWQPSYYDTTTNDDQRIPVVGQVPGRTINDGVPLPSDWKQLRTGKARTVYAMSI